MSVTRDDIEWIAHLARLELDPGEADDLTEDLNEILRHIDTLREASAAPGDRAAPTDDAHREGGAPLRDGRSDRPDPLEVAPSETAPAWRDGFFVVPKLPAVDAEDPATSSGSGAEGASDGRSRRTGDPGGGTA